MVVMHSCVKVSRKEGTDVTISGTQRTNFRCKPKRGCLHPLAFDVSRSDAALRWHRQCSVDESSVVQEKVDRRARFTRGRAQAWCRRTCRRTSVVQEDVQEDVRRWQRSVDETTLHAARSEFGPTPCRHCAARTFSSGCDSGCIPFLACLHFPAALSQAT